MLSAATVQAMTATTRAIGFDWIRLAASRITIQAASRLIAMTISRSGHLAASATSSITASSAIQATGRLSVASRWNTTRPKADWSGRSRWAISSRLAGRWTSAATSRASRTTTACARMA